MFKYSEDEIKKDIEDFIKSDCCVWSMDPGYYKKMQEYIAVDKEQLEKLLNQGKSRTLMLDYRSVIDKDKTNFDMKSFKMKEIAASFKKVFGKDDIRYLGVSVCRRNEAGKLCLNEGYANLGNGLAAIGKCYRFSAGADDRMVVYGVNDKTMSGMCATFYHEIAHALQTKLELFVPKMEAMVLNFYKEQVRPLEQKYNKGRLSEKLGRYCEYIRYQEEVQAELFAYAVPIIKDENPDNFEANGNKMLQIASWRMINGLGDEEALYNFWPQAQILMQDLRQLGASGCREKFVKNDQVDFVGLAKYTAQIVKLSAYSKEEFFWYKNWQKRIQPEKMQQIPILKRVADDYETAQKSVQSKKNEESDKADLRNLWRAMIATHDRQKIWDLLNPKNEEKKQKYASFRELFLKYNRQALPKQDLYAQKLPQGR